MSLSMWSRSNLEYGRKLIHSGLDGARSGQEDFLHGKPARTLLDESVRNALTLGAIGACLGALGGHLGKQKRSLGYAFALTMVGGAVGFAAGMGWKSRRLMASAATGALKNIGRTRDEHWLEQNPIDYA